MKKSDIDTSPWLRSYDARVPASLDYPQVSIPDLLDMQAAKYPDATALILDDQSLSYKVLQLQARIFAQNLRQIGFHIGDRLGICLENTPEFVIGFYGCLYAGGIVCALNPVFPKSELQYQVDLAGIDLVFTSRTKATDFLQLTPEGQPLQVIVVGNEEENRETQSTFTIDYQDMLKLPKNGEMLAKIDPEQAAVFQFSGGTTGKPKAAIGSHRNIVANARQFRTWIHNLEEGQETFLVSIPLYHVYGMVLGLNLGVALGAKIVMTRSARDVDLIIKALQRHKVTFFPAVPSLFNTINQHPLVESGKVDLSGIKACISGSAPLSQSTKSIFERRTGCRLMEGYGLSEAPTATHCNPLNGENKLGSIGLPLPDVDCKIVDMDNPLHVVKKGLIGELWIKGPQVMSGYFGDTMETSEVLIDGWLRTGDAAFMDDDGYFYLAGRLKELIKVHGLQVWPIEVEKVIAQIPGVKESAVIGIPDENQGERVKAWIVMEDNRKLSLATLREFCNGKLAGYKIPGDMQICDHLPRNSIGKVLKRELEKLPTKK